MGGIYQDNERAYNQLVKLGKDNLLPENFLQLSEGQQENILRELCERPICPSRVAQGCNGRGKGGPTKKIHPSTYKKVYKYLNKNNKEKTKYAYQIINAVYNINDKFKKDEAFIDVVIKHLALKFKSLGDINIRKTINCKELNDEASRSKVDLGAFLFSKIEVRLKRYFYSKTTIDFRRYYEAGDYVREKIADEFFWKMLQKYVAKYLSERHLLIFTQFYLEGWTDNDISKQFNCTYQYIYKQRKEVVDFLIRYREDVLKFIDPI